MKAKVSLVRILCSVVLLGFTNRLLISEFDWFSYTKHIQWFSVGEKLRKTQMQF